MSTRAIRVVAAFAVLCFGLAACDADKDRAKGSADGHQQSGGVRGDVESLENSRQTVVELLRRETYEDARGASACAGQCAGQNAGFAWAKANEIFDGGACRGNSATFIAGCRAYAEEVASRALNVEVSKESE
jgi:hypothetical protein